MTVTTLQLIEKVRLPGKLKGYLMDYDGFEFMVIYQTIEVSGERFFLVRELRIDASGMLLCLKPDDVDEKLIEMATSLGISSSDEHIGTVVFQLIAHALKSMGAEEDDEGGAGDREPRDPLPSPPAATVQLALGEGNRLPDDHPASADAVTAVGGGADQSLGGAADDDIPF